MLFVDFIYYLPFKLKELRVQAEDTARTIEDCERARKPLPDNLKRDYEYFLEMVRSFVRLLFDGRDVRSDRSM